MAKILEILDDGRWHTLDEIRQETRMNRFQTGKVMQFLVDYGFIVLDDTKEKVKLDEKAQRFLTHSATS
jgi:DNA-binding IclR family transcriptional regulator